MTKKVVKNCLLSLTQLMIIIYDNKLSWHILWKMLVVFQYVKISRQNKLQFSVGARVLLIYTEYGIQAYLKTRQLKLKGLFIKDITGFYYVLLCYLTVFLNYYLIKTTQL